MLIAFSVNGVPIRLPGERWSHIVERHPELKGEKEKVIEAIAELDLVQKGDVGTLLATMKINDKFLSVVYR